MNFVIDTSALVALSGIGRLDLLRGCCVCVGVPQAVRFELCDQGQGWTEASAAQAEILSGSWLKTVSVARSPTYGMLRTQVGAGETECIEFARTAKLTAILDDHDARKEAMRLGIPLVGSLGIGVARVGAHHPGAVALGQTVVAHEAQDTSIQASAAAGERPVNVMEVRLHRWPVPHLLPSAVFRLPVCVYSTISRSGQRAA